MVRYKEFGFPDKGLWKFYYMDAQRKILASWIVDFENEIVDDLHMDTAVDYVKPFGTTPIPTFEDFFWFMNRRLWTQCGDTKFDSVLSTYGCVPTDDYRIDWKVLE